MKEEVGGAITVIVMWLVIAPAVVIAALLYLSKVL